MLNATLALHLKKFPSSVAKDMKSNLYIDNGYDSEQQLMDYYIQSRSIMKQANFNLRLWSSNSLKLRATLKVTKQMTPAHVSAYWVYIGTC